VPEQRSGCLSSHQLRQAGGPTENFAVQSQPSLHLMWFLEIVLLLSFFSSRYQCHRTPNPSRGSTLPKTLIKQLHISKAVHWVKRKPSKQKSTLTNPITRMRMLASLLLLVGSTTLVAAGDCGPGVGSCQPGWCCSESGWCGKTKDYCKGPQCQLAYSDSCDT
jgi:hypothetical protein